MDLIDCETGFQGKHFAASEFQNTLADDATTKTNRLKVHVFTIIQSKSEPRGRFVLQMFTTMQTRSPFVQVRSML